MKYMILINGVEFLKLVLPHCLKKLKMYTRILKCLLDIDLYLKKKEFNFVLGNIKRAVACAMHMHDAVRMYL